MTMTMAGPVLAFHPLSFVPDGDDVVVGRRDIDSYGVFPADGAALVRQLAAGRPVADAARWYEQTYGEAVDLDAFVGTLAELEFLAPPGPSRRCAEPVRWQRLGRALFSPVALIALRDGRRRGDRHLDRRPRLAPRPGHIFFVSSFVVVELTMVLGQLPLSGIHELAHLLAGRRLGLRSRIRLSNRFYFVVFETTWTGSSASPAASATCRCSPGWAPTSSSMAALTVSAAALPPGSLGSRVCLALAFSTLPRIVWQLYLFLQTDVYYLARHGPRLRRPARHGPPVAGQPLARRLRALGPPRRRVGVAPHRPAGRALVRPADAGRLRRRAGDDGWSSPRRWPGTSSVAPPAPCSAGDGGSRATLDAAVLFAISAVHVSLAFVLSRRQRRTVQLRRPRHDHPSLPPRRRVAGRPRRDGARRRSPPPRGPYTAAGALVRAIVPMIDDAGLLQRHDVEILTVAPVAGGDDRRTGGRR